ncbi:MAG TPA: response regulator transcription factor [Opitutaceae bacterium]|nr:response regulator transcription factor [Opitutaceae bacterium]
MKKARVILVDDHAVLRRGMKNLIDAESDMEVVGEADDGARVLALVEKLKPDVVVMDLSMSGMGGAEATRRLKEKELGCKILVLTVHEDRNYLREVLEAGALGYMLKRAAAEELVQAIRAIASGTVFIDSRVATKLINVMVEDPSSDACLEAPGLAKREFDVLRHIAEGFSNKEIAARLKISVKTVETYKARGMDKLGISSRVDIVRTARERQWPHVK